MPPNDDQILHRLEDTIQSWSGEVTDAHTNLTRQIGEAKDQLSTLIKVIAARNKNGHALTQTLDEMNELRHLLTRREDELTEALRENVDLRSQIEEIHEGGDAAPVAGPAADPELVAERDREIDSLQQELRMARGELQETVRALAEARQDAAALAVSSDETELPSFSEDAESLSGVLDSVQREIDELQAATEASFREEDEVTLKRIELLEKKLGDEQQHAAGLAEELDSARTELANVLRSLDARDAEIEELRASADGTPDAALLESLVREKDDIETMLREAREEAAALRHTQQEQEKALLLARTQTDALREQLAEKADAGASDDLQIELDELRRRYEDQSEVIDKHANASSEKDRLIEELNEKITTLTARHAAESDNDDAQAVQVASENQELKAALRARDAELDSLMTQLDEPGDAEADKHKRIEFAAYDSENRKRSMGEILVNAGIVSRKQLEKALEEQKNNKQRRLGSILVQKGLIHEEIVAKVLASQLQLPFVKLAEETIQPEATRLMNGRLATHHMCIPIRVEDGSVTVAMANPHDLIALEDIEIATEHAVVPVVATLPDITASIVRCYGVDPPSEHADAV